MIRRMLCHVCIALLVHASAHNLACADTHYVSLSGNHVTPFTNWGDAATNIQSAIDVAVGNATVLVSNGTYRLQAEVIIGTNITLESASGREATIVDGCHTTRCFRLLPDAGCVVRGFSITNGLAATNEAGGGVWIGAGNMLADCVVVGCSAELGGGAYVSNAVVSNCTFRGSVANFAGGGIHSDGGLIVRSTAEGNQALVGGGLSLSLDGATLGADGCVFTGNTADAGGGVFCGPLSNVVEAVSMLLENAANYSNALASLDFGAVNFTNMLSGLATGQQTVPPPGTAGSPGCPAMMRASCDLSLYSHVIRNCYATGNTAVCGGGLFMLDAPDAAVSNCVIAQNAAQLGGGLCIQNGGDTIESTLQDNEAALFGGGIFIESAGLMLNCHVVSNRADMVAGGCAVGVFGAVSLGDFPGTCNTAGSGADSLRVLGSEFIGNSAEMMGGGLMLDAGSMATSNTFFRNSASWGGGAANFGGVLSGAVLVENNAEFGAGILSTGGETARCAARYNAAEWTGGGMAAIAAAFGSSVLVTQCTVEHNFAPAGGGIVLVDSALARRCTVASNTAGMAGGGVFTMLGGEIQSSLIRHNTAGDGGGIYCLNGGHVINSTVAVNDALNSGGGLCSVTNEFGFGWNYDTETVVANSIVYGNSASNAPNFLNLASNVVYSYTCTFPAIPGTGNITNPPLFVDAVARDYHLEPSSPCVDAGNNGLMPSGTDLDGLSRPLDGDNDGTATVDMGCYEHLNSDGDSDGDSMPDGWEFEHGLNLVADDSGGDADGDSINNGGEYAADTDPQDGNSVLSILDISTEMGGIRIDWKGGRQAWQFLECRSNLVSTGDQWTAILAVPPPTPITNAVIDLGAEGESIFYRLRVER